MAKVQSQTQRRRNPTETRKQKPFSSSKLNNISPLTEGQKVIWQEWVQGNHIAMLGSAGTGKSFLAVYLALKELFDKDTDIEQLVVCRSIEPTKDIGHLPGDINEKSAPYETPYTAIFKELLNFEKSYDTLKSQDKIRFLPTSFVRGISLHNTIVFIDEVQNMTFHELYSVLTRVGKHSRVIIGGDIKQSDLSKNSCYDKLTILLDHLDEFSVRYFTSEDIVRSGFVRNLIKTAEKLDLI